MWQIFPSENDLPGNVLLILMPGLTHPGRMSARLSFSNYYKLFPNQRIIFLLKSQLNRERAVAHPQPHLTTHTVVAGYLLLYKCPAGSVLSYDDISLMKLWLLTPPTHSQQFVTICLGLSPQSLAAGTHPCQPAVSPRWLKFSSNIWFYV